MNILLLVYKNNNFIGYFYVYGQIIIENIRFLILSGLKLEKLYTP